MMAKPREEGFEQRRALLQGRVVTLLSYRAGDRFVARVDNLDPATVIARGEGHSRAEAESAVLAVARHRLERNKQLHDTLTELHTRVASLDKRLSEPPPPSLERRPARRDS
jgi:hypothetical protein